jgi:proteasome-associated ATPase
MNRGDEVVLNESFAIIEVRPGDAQGEVVTVKEIIDERRVLISGRGDDERVVERADVLADVKLRAG